MTGLGPSAEIKPRSWWSGFLPILGGLGLFLSGMVAAGVVTVLVAGPARLAHPGALQEWFRRPPAMVVALLASGVFCSLAVLAAARASRMGLRARLGLVRSRLAPREWPWVVFAGMAALVLGGLLRRILRDAGLSLPIDKGTAALGAALLSAGWALKLALLGCASVLAPIAEELTFRGFIQRGVLARWRPGAAIGVVAVLFALFHGSPGHSIAVLPFAVWLGYVAWRADSIRPTLVGHAASNAFFTSLLVVRPQPAALLRHAGPAAKSGPTLVLSLLAALLCLWVIAAVARRIESRCGPPAPGAEEPVRPA